MTEVKPEVIVITDDDSDDDRPDCKPTNTKKKLLRKKKHKLDDSDDDRLECKPTNTKKKLLSKKKRKVDDSNDHRLQCKPTNTKKKLLSKKKRKVERILNTSSNSETLVITQKVRKQKFKCIINLSNIFENREKQKRKFKPRSTILKKIKFEKRIPYETEVAKVKKIIPNAKKVSKVEKIMPNSKEVAKVEKIIPNEKEVAKIEKIVPDCLRKRCKIYENRIYDNYLSKRQKKEIRRKMLDKSGKEKTASFEKKKNCSCEISQNEINMSPIRKTRRVEPTQRRSHSSTRYLSPISSDSLSDVLSECNDDIMSYDDISSDSIIENIEIETLIKRTKDRERNTSLNRAYDYKYSPALPSTPPRHNSISCSKILDETKDHTFSYKTYDSRSFEKAQLDVYKSRNKTCAVKPVTHKPRYDCITDITNISLPKTDEPRHVNERIIDVDSKYESNFMSTPKYEGNSEIVDSSSSDGDTVLSGEMDIVSFHSQGTLVLDPFYSPSHPTESPSLICDVYSPTMSPEFFYHEGVIENTLLHCNPSPISPVATHLIPNSATELSSLIRHMPYSSSDSPIIPIQMNIDFKNLSDLDTLESNVKREQSWESKEVKVEHTSPKIDIGYTAIDTKNVKVEAAGIPEKLSNIDIAESPISYVTIKEEINEDSINNNISLKPYNMLNSSVRICNNFEDNNVGIKKEE